MLKSEVSRRKFLFGATTALAGLSLTSLSLLGSREVQASAVELVVTPQYSSWQDLYRQRWTWDKIAKGTHHVNCWYQRGCNWNIYVKDGVVFREEQAADYPQINDEVPDYNPRGCQKGGCFSHRMYDAGRIQHPLKRVGKRGEGKWQRISWQQALEEVADTIVDTLVEHGADATVWDLGTAGTNGCNGLGLVRTSQVLGTPFLTTNADIGDHHPGAMATVGKISFASSADDMFYSDVILIWGGNPVYTQIPNAHFINEARYKGAHIITIAPDYNASSIHADTWVPVNVGTDAALGLAICQVMVQEGLHDEAFIREQTDMPFLVRKDNQLFLRESDLKKGGSDDLFYFFDETLGKPRQASQDTLALEGSLPALEGEFTVTTLAGDIVVETVFTGLKRQLEDYTPEKASKITGTPASVIRYVARRIGNAKAATMLTQSNFSKFYHGIEMERVQILVFSLAGQVGKKGSGITGFPILMVDNADMLGLAPGWLHPKLGVAAVGLQHAPDFIKAKLKGLTTEMVIYELARKEYKSGGFLSTNLLLHQHGGLKERFGGSQQWDPAMTRSLQSYLDEAVEKGWQQVPITPPRVFIEAGGNLLRRVRSYDQLYEGFLPKLDMMVTVDWRMSNTALHSDYVFPAAAWYERDDVTWGTPIAPYCHVTTAAVKPLAESKTDWEFHCLLMKKIGERALQRGFTSYQDRSGEERRFDKLWSEFSFNGRYDENSGEKVLEDTFDLISNLNGISWQEIKEKGYERFTGLGMSLTNIGNATNIEPNETITANTWHTNDKVPWPTLTRRMQFYIDHPFYLELGEALPVHKDPPAIGGDYPLVMTGGHTRWSIHSMWQDSALLQRLQRGEPTLVIAKSDAEQRGLYDGDDARVFNDMGSIEVQIRVSMALRPGQTIMYHAWEPYQFKDRKSHQTLSPSPINPLQLAGGYFHLQPNMLFGEPGSNDRDTRIEVQRVS